MTDDDLSKLRLDKSQISSIRSKKKRYGVLLVALLSLTAIGILYQQGLLTPAVTVQVTSVQNIYPSQTFTLLNASGYVVAQRKAAVASKITSQLIYLAVEEGDHVKKGQIIARLESADAAASRDRARANVAVARFNLQQAQTELRDALTKYQRNQKLLSHGSISQTEYDTSEARYHSAKAGVASAEAAVKASEAALREAQATLEYATIRAPFDAVVLTKDADMGDIVTPLGAAANAKAAVVTIADMSSLQVEADVSESNIGMVKVGQPCEIQLDALPNSRFPGKVHTIVPTADRSKASVMVKVAFLNQDPRVLPEMSAKVAFLSRQVLPGEEQLVTAVPRSAIISDTGRNQVFLVRNGRARAEIVRTGRKLGSMMEIVAGIMPGDTVIMAPLSKIRDGVKVKLALE